VTKVVAVLLPFVGRFSEIARNLEKWHETNFNANPLICNDIWDVVRHPGTKISLPVNP